MSHVLVRFNEDGHEQEMAVLTNWERERFCFIRIQLRPNVCSRQGLNQDQTGNPIL